MGIDEVVPGVGPGILPDDRAVGDVVVRVDDRAPDAAVPPDDHALADDALLDDASRLDDAVVPLAGWVGFTDAVALSVALAEVASSHIPGASLLPEQQRMRAAELHDE